MLLFKRNREVKLNQTEPITKLGSDAKTAPAVYGVIGKKVRQQICLNMQSGYAHWFK